MLIVLICLVPYDLPVYNLKGAMNRGEMKFMIPEGKHYGIAGALNKDMASWMSCEESKPVPFFEDWDVS